MPNLTALTPSELLDLAAPLVAKINCREALTELEAELHEQIVAEARRQHDALRASELQERAERFA